MYPLVEDLAVDGIPIAVTCRARSCSQQRIWSVFAKKRGLIRRAGPPVHDGLVRKQFTATAANRVWLTGITEHPTGEGKLYLCAIKDVYSGRIVGYSIDSRMKASLAVSALRTRSGSALRPGPLCTRTGVVIFVPGSL